MVFPHPDGPIRQTNSPGLISKETWFTAGFSSKEEVQKYIDMVGLNGFEKALPHHLSGGMQQRAAFARALINRPKVLLLDEPFGALDAFTRVALQERLIDLWKNFGYTAVMVTHDAEEAVALATRSVQSHRDKPLHPRSSEPCSIPYLF